MTPTYRPAVAEDIAACVDIRGRTRENAIPAERLAAMGITVASWARDVETGALPGFVCIENDRIAGYCFGDVASGEVVVLALLPQYEAQGIGRRLLGLVVEQLSAAGHKRLFLGCAADSNTRSHGFYRHLGWRSTGTIDRFNDEVLEWFPPAARFRPLLPSDQSALWHWLHIALWDPPPAPLRPRAVLDDAGVRIYAEGWGAPTDVGVVAVVGGQDAGACWMRLIRDGAGLAYVDDDTPQLGVALAPEFQHRGFGKPMMRAALQAAWAHGYRQVSLTVHPENPAMRVYEACGFVECGLRRNYRLMVARHAP